MDEDYRLRNITKEDLANFNNIEQKALALPFVKDSVDYLLSVLYRFENYVVEKMSHGNNEEWRLRQTKTNEKTDLISIVDRIDEYGDELSLEERVFISKVKNLITHQMRRLHADDMYPKSRLKNKNTLLLEEHIRDKSENKKDKIVWLVSKEQLEKLIIEWQKNQFIEEKNVEKVISNFCDINGELFSTTQKDKIRWCKKITELVAFIGEMVNSKFKFIAGDEIWVKVCKCFINNDGSELNHYSLAVAYQNAKPKSKGSILKIIKTISDDPIEK